MQPRDSPYGVHLDFAVVHMDAGRATVEFVVAEYHLNTLGIVHGGVTSSIIDHAAGAAIISLGTLGGRRALTTKLEVEFLASIKSGRVECEAIVGRQEGDRIEVAATVTSEGRPRARGKIEFKPTRFGSKSAVLG